MQSQRTVYQWKCPYACVTILIAKCYILFGAVKTPTTSRNKALCMQPNLISKINSPDTAQDCLLDYFV